MNNYYKTGVFLLIALLLFGSGIAGIPEKIIGTNTSPATTLTSSTTLSIQPSALQIKQTAEGYTSVGIPEASASIMNEGEPILPYLIKTLTFPLGTCIIDLNATIDNMATQHLEASVEPASNPLPYNMQLVKQERYKGPVYDTDTLYPLSWIQYQTKVGLRQNEHVIFLILQVFPVRYAPQTNMLHFANQVDIKITYELPTVSLETTDGYDLLIVAPDEFLDALQPLVQHKEDYGVATKMVSLTEIYAVGEGRDEAEQVKYFIKNALEEWDITYVLLVGGRHGGLLQEKWWCPVRYSYLSPMGDSDKRFLSDLYFADIYGYEEGETVFADWDSNENSLFGEWSIRGKDTVDMYPDVYLGRLPCRNSFEVSTMVDKIITYETMAYGKNWANHYIGIGGDTFPGDQWYDGEESVLKTIDYLEPLDMEFTTLFTSDNTLTEGQDIIDAVNQGCGFLHFEGHGNPMSWANHPPQDGGTWIGIDESQFMLFKNNGMYPVCVIGGCSNSKFNISLLNLLKFNNLEEIYSHADYGPESFGWWIVRAINKGAIASIGCTSYGYGKQGDSNDDGIFDGIQYRGGFIDIEFFRVYAQEDTFHLGAAHGTAITNFLLKFPPLTDHIDSKTVEEWVLFGDPSLKIGGYP